MKRHWAVIAGISLLCISIWSFLLISIFDVNVFQERLSEENNDGMLYDYYAEEFDSLNEPGPSEDPVPKEDDEAKEKENFDDSFAAEPDTAPGEENVRDNSKIYPGDYRDVAPEGIISIDVLLGILLKDDDEDTN